MPTALVVDDDPSIRDLFAMTLELHGWSVETAVDGQDALDRMDGGRDPFDMVLLDIMMPRLTGMQVLEHMVSDQRLRDIPRIVVSAKDDSLERKFALELGAAAWLSKPLTPERLVSAIEERLSDVIDGDVIPVVEVPDPNAD